MNRKKNLGLWITLLIVVLISVIDIPTYSKFLLIALFLGSLLYYRRSVIFYIRANSKITSKKEADWQYAWPLYRKAIKAGLQKPFVITAASMFLQRGDAEEGKQIIEGYFASEKGRNENLDNVAKTMVSMAYWMDGDLDKAIECVREVHESGYQDKNLFINYTTYALAAGDLEKAEELLEEAGHLEESSPGIRDSRGWLYLLRGNWEEADTLFKELVEKGPRFPEPYVHHAQVKIHFGQVGDAIELLKKALDARYANTSGFSKEIIQDMIDGLENPETRRKRAMEIENDTASVALGKSPASIDQDFPPEEGYILEGFAKPKKQKKSAPKQQKKSPIESDDRTPNTDLTEEDLEYIRKHNLE
ncbi:pilus assembly protein PilF [uncultured Sphaerochaeta sp.]|uniref:pilus assembly protein PilF n=1 Tax=uncultured Sphaerochaeta sp. TaxID=886478 RepID=UPI002A0A12E7|nr:pilus assembly protein PilF [uncultured Sphaerochaeta sp.]